MVTGGAGFIGSHLVEALLKGKKRRVIVLDDLSSGLRSNVPDGAIFVKGNCGDSETVRTIFADYNVKTVFHLAAHPYEACDLHMPYRTWSNVTLDSISLITECVRRIWAPLFVFASTAEIYGDGPGGEDDPGSPTTVYGCAKQAVERHLATLAREGWIDYVALRVQDVYGPRQRIGFVHEAMEAFRSEQTIQLLDGGRQRVDFSYVDDVVNLFLRAESPDLWNQAFNAGAVAASTVRDVVAGIGAICGLPCEIEEVDAEEPIRDRAYSHAKSLKFFPDLRRQVPLDEGLRRTWAWYSESEGVPALAEPRFEVRDPRPQTPAA